MPYREPDAEDPMEIVATEFEATEDEVRDMASCFAEEFARLGYSREQILSLFHNQFYVPAYGAWKQLGEQNIRELIAEAMFICGRRET